MERTIKEKMRVAFERDLEVDVKWGKDFGMTGCISSYAPHLMLMLPDGECESIEYRDITDVRFVEEECRDPEVTRYILSYLKDLRNSKASWGEESQRWFDKTIEGMEQELATEKTESHDIARQMKIHIVDESCEDDKTDEWNEARAQIEAQKNTINTLVAEVTELKRSLSEPVQSTVEECGRDVETDVDGFRKQLEHALSYGYAVEVEFRDRGSSGHYTGLLSAVDDDACSFSKPGQDRFKVDLNAVTMVAPILEYTKEDEAVHDIASERWDWTQYRIVRTEPYDLAPLFERHKATDAQIKLAVAAPELADIMRKEVNDRASVPGRLSPRTKKWIHLLRKLGVPNVAPWYKDEDDEAVYNYAGEAVTTRGQNESEKS